MEGFKRLSDRLLPLMEKDKAYSRTELARLLGKNRLNPCDTDFLVKMAKQGLLKEIKQKRRGGITVQYFYELGV